MNLNFEQTKHDNFVSPAMLKRALLSRDDDETLRLLTIVCKRQGQAHFHQVKYSDVECEQVAENILSQINWEHVGKIKNAYRFFRSASRRHMPRKLAG